MFRFLRAAAFLCACFFSAPSFAWQTPTAVRRAACVADNDPIPAPEVLLFHHQFAAAEPLARTELSVHPDSSEANEHVVRALIGLDHFEEAVTQAQAFAGKHPEDALAQAALAEAYLRAGRIDDARVAISAAHKLNPCEARHQIVGARLFEMGGYHKTSAQWFSLAHRLRPPDEDATEGWLESLPRARRAEELSKRINAAKDIAPQRKMAEAEHIRKLLAPPHACTATTKSARTEIPMTFVTGNRGVGIDLKLNGKQRTLKVDTGASGINLSFGAAKRLNLVAEEEFNMIGVGQQGMAKSYRTHVDHIVIGDLEFTDCTVDVYHTPNDLGMEDGLIGLDTFENFLITLDFQSKHVLILEPLPPRPGEAAGTTLSASTTTSDSAADNPLFDKYVDPSMKDWDDIFRSGHDLLMPVHLNKGEARMLVADTGADVSLLTMAAAKGSGKVSRDYQTDLYGVNGRVDELYKVEDVELNFNRFHVGKRTFLVSDMARFSHNSGIEISGLLGIDFLGVLDIKLDYRDNLIKLGYTRHYR